jgi:hypothetical protein
MITPGNPFAFLPGFIDSALTGAVIGIVVAYVMRRWRLSRSLCVLGAYFLAVIDHLCDPRTTAVTAALTAAAVICLCGYLLGPRWRGLTTTEAVAWTLAWPISRFWWAGPAMVTVTVSALIYAAIAGLSVTIAVGVGIAGILGTAGGWRSGKAVHAALSTINQLLHEKWQAYGGRMLIVTIGAVWVLHSTTKASIEVVLIVAVTLRISWALGRRLTTARP